MLVTDESSKRPILLVEDSQSDRLLMQRAFKKSKLGNKLIVARDGQEALDYLFGDDQDESAPLPILVLLDIKLPRVDGFEVLKAIRENKRTRFLPVVILTSSKEQEDLIQGYELGANSYIRKPVDFNKFAEAVQQLGFYWLLLNEIISE